MLISGAFNGNIKGLIMTSCINKLVVVTCEQTLYIFVYFCK